MPSTKNWQANVAVAHHHKHHLYETCVAYREVDRWAGFLTSRFAVDRGLLDTLTKVPIGKVSRIAKRMLAYHDPRIRDQVWLYAPTIPKKLALSVLGGRRFFSGSSFVDAAAEWAAQHEVAVHSHVTGSTEIFERIAPLGLPCLLEMYLGDRLHGRGILERELESLGMPNGEKEMLALGHGQRQIDRCRRECELADFVFCPSPFVLDSMRDAGVPEAKLVFAPYGSTPPKSKPAFLPRLASDPLRVAFVGTEGVRKGLVHLIRATEKLAPRVEVHVFGMASFSLPGFEYRSDLIKFHGFKSKPDMLAELATMHVGCLPSLFEGSAIGVYDYLGTGLPVVVTPNAGTLVTNGKEGFVVPAQDSDAIASAFEALYADEDLRRSMAESAAALAVECSWARYRAATVAPLLSMSNSPA